MGPEEENKTPNLEPIQLRNLKNTRAYSRQRISKKINKINSELDSFDEYEINSAISFLKKLFIRTWQIRFSNR